MSSIIIKQAKDRTHRHHQPRGARPRTVGHADDSPKMQSQLQSIMDRNAMQGRLEVLRTSLDFGQDSEALSSEQASTEPSPRRYLPRIPAAEQDDIESVPSPSVTRRAGKLQCYSYLYTPYIISKENCCNPLFPKSCVLNDVVYV